MHPVAANVHVLVAASDGDGVYPIADYFACGRCVVGWLEVNNMCAVVARPRWPRACRRSPSGPSG